MIRPPLFVLLVALSFTALACGGDDPTSEMQPPIPNIPPPTDGSPDGMSMCPSAAPLPPTTTCSGTPALQALAEMPTFAVVNGDYQSTSIALLRADATILERSWIDSGTTPPGLVAALSGDVVLPSAQASDGSLTLLDRSTSNVMMRFCMPSGDLVGQVRTQDGMGATSSYSSNPQDVLWTAEDRAWVTRYEPNLDPDAAVLERGDDLYALDPLAMQRRGERLDLSSFHDTADDAMGAAQTTYARPSSAVRVGSRAVVALDRIDLGFSAYAPGAVAIVELSDDVGGGAVSSLPLAGLRNCGNVVAVPCTADRVVVSCLGGPYADPEQQRASSGLVLVSVPGTGAPQIERAWKLADYPDAPRAVERVVALGGTLVLAIASGTFSPPSNDTAYRIDLANGSVSEVLQTPGQYKLGSAAFDPTTGLLLLPYAGNLDPPAPAVVYRLRLAPAEAPQLLGTLTVDPALPPRAVRLLRR